MKSKTYVRLAAAALSCLYLQSCALDEYFESRVEQYTKSFIKEFGLVDPEQDWSMGQNANAEINIGAHAARVRIYGKYGNSYYKVADLANVEGQLSIPVHVPKTCTDMAVNVDGRIYYGTFGASLNCTGVTGRGLPEATYDASGNTSATVYEKAVGKYKVEVKHTQSGNDTSNKAYQQFNTQQMAPLVSPDVWNDYFSLNTNEMVYNTNKDEGLLPESGIFNHDKAYLDNVLKNAVSDVAVDFSVSAGDNGSFTIFPYYYGTNIIHTLGIYLVNDKGEPINAEGNPTNDKDEMVMLPIFDDDDCGDMQIQPNYCPNIAKIEVYNQHGIKADWDNAIKLNVGETYQLDVRLYDSNNNQIAYDDAFKKQWHSRIGFHAWVDDFSHKQSDGTYTFDHPRRYGTVFVTCDETGLITAVKDTHGYDSEDLKEGKYYMQAAIATGLDGRLIKGVEFDFPVIVTDPNPSTDPDPDPGTLKDKVFVPDDVAKTVGETWEENDNRIKVTIISGNTADGQTANFPSIVGITGIWGDWGNGGSKCLYEKDENGLLKKDSNNNLILASGQIAALLEDIKSSMANNSYTITRPWVGQTISTDVYEAVGINFLNEISNEGWLQFDLYVKKKGQTSAPRRSRADIPAEYAGSLTDNGQWKDVHRAWSRYLPYGKEVASYQLEMPMLARTRGYDVKITNADGTPYTGKFGMYISMKEQYPSDKIVPEDMSEPYILYSQRALNKYGQRTAAAFKHPKSGRTFFAFEDMDLTHKWPDDDLTPGDNTGMGPYIKGEKSSDRDVNDLIFLINGYEEIKGDKDIKPEVDFKEEGFNWIWALEDLGSTGDFDFNDLVMRITDMATTETTTTPSAEEGGKPTVTTKVVRKLKFLPLAAGGTLSMHIHLKYNGQEYTLAPGEYDLTKGEAPVGKELHKWFGEIPVTTMINTGISTPINTTDKDNACTLVLSVSNSKSFTIGDLLKSGDGTNNSDKLFVVVQGDGSETWNTMQAIDQDRLTTTDGAYLVPLPEKGKAAQSFFILDNSGNEWQWMREYEHILKGYPKFADWISDPKVDWTAEKEPDALYSK